MSQSFNPNLEVLDGRELLSAMACVATAPYNEGGTGIGAVPFYDIAFFTDSDYESVDYSAYDKGVPPVSAWIDWGDGGAQNYTNPNPTVTVTPRTGATDDTQFSIDWGNQFDVSEGYVEESTDGGVYAVAGTHRYLTSGDYNITVVAVDLNGNVATAHTVAHVNLVSDGGDGGSGTPTQLLA